MLTEAEKKWLEERSSPRRLALCSRSHMATRFFDMTQKHCHHCDLHRSGARKYCPLVSDYRDAAEFEARVAAKLAADVESYFEIRNGARIPIRRDKNVFLRLKHARIEAEQEMEE